MFRACSWQDLHYISINRIHTVAYLFKIDIVHEIKHKEIIIQEEKEEDLRTDRTSPLRPLSHNKRQTAK